MFNKLWTWWLMRPEKLKKRLGLAKVWSHFYSRTFEDILYVQKTVEDWKEAIRLAPVISTAPFESGLDKESPDIIHIIGRRGPLVDFLAQESLMGACMRSNGYVFRLDYIEEAPGILVILFGNRVETKPTLYKVRALLLCKEDFEIAGPTEDWAYLRRKSKDLPITHIAREKALKKLIKPSRKIKPFPV